MSKLQVLPAVPPRARHPASPCRPEPGTALFCHRAAGLPTRRLPPALTHCVEASDEETFPHLHTSHQLQLTSIPLPH